MPFYVYILQSETEQSFYIGYSQNLENRVNEHNLGNTRYSKSKRPWKLVYHEIFDDKTEVIKRERFLKKQKSRAFYLKLIAQTK
jgi:putative endonuclease